MCPKYFCLKLIPKVQFVLKAHKIVLQKVLSFRCIERRFVSMDVWSSLFFLLNQLKTQTHSLLTLPIFLKWWQIIDLAVLRSSFNSYFCSDWIPPILIKHLDRGLMNVIICVHLWHIAATKPWKVDLDLAVSNDTLAINITIFLSCFCNVFVILKLPQHYISNMPFQIFHFRVVRSDIKLWCALFHYWNKNDRQRYFLIR